jgi:hypothetical protein
VVDLSVADDAAAALCADGRVTRSTTGREWSTVATAEGALALALTPERPLVVLALPGCHGLAVADASAPDSALGCAPVDTDSLAPGTVALAAGGADAWLMAGDAVFRSSGDLSAWSTTG